MAKIIRSKCLGCGICSGICPEGIEVVDGKAEIKNENANCLKEAANACPQKAIIIDEKENIEFNSDKEGNLNSDINQRRGIGRGLGRRFGGNRRGRGKRF